MPTTTNAGWSAAELVEPAGDAHRHRQAGAAAGSASGRRRRVAGATPCRRPPPPVAVLRRVGGHGGGGAGADHAVGPAVEAGRTARTLAGCRIPPIAGRRPRSSVGPIARTSGASRTASGVLAGGQALARGGGSRRRSPARGGRSSRPASTGAGIAATPGSVRGAGTQHVERHGVLQPEAAGGGAHQRAQVRPRVQARPRSRAMRGRTVPRGYRTSIDGDRPSRVGACPSQQVKR